MDNTHGLYNCNICNKNYSSYKSLWNHNKQFHTISVCKVTDGNGKILENNIWGSFKDILYSYQCIFVISGEREYRGYFWNIDGCQPSIISYPEIYTGTKPFSDNSQYSNQLLGKKIYEYNLLNIYIDMFIFDF